MRRRRDESTDRREPSGFTIIEVLVTMMILAMLFALILPNLGALVPAARLRGSGSQIRRELDWVRSEARIQGKRMVMEFDLERARWRIVLPPEQRLTRDQAASELEERPEHWIALETDVGFVGAGDGKAGLTSRGVYSLVFDEYGFTGDQVLVLALQSQPSSTWTMTVHGLSGRVDVHESENGEKPLPQVPNEGAF
jgi:prepilin-type N-terminal cleavage/methylation domain-containing protein